MLTILYFGWSIYILISDIISDIIISDIIIPRVYSGQCCSVSFWWFMFETEWLPATKPVMPGCWVISTWRYRQYTCRNTYTQRRSIQDRQQMLVLKDHYKATFKTFANMKFCLSYILQSTDSIMGNLEQLQLIIHPGL